MDGSSDDLRGTALLHLSELTLLVSVVKLLQLLHLAGVQWVDTNRMQLLAVHVKFKNRGLPVGKGPGFVLHHELADVKAAAQLLLDLHGVVEIIGHEAQTAQRRDNLELEAKRLARAGHFHTDAHRAVDAG